MKVLVLAHGPNHIYGPNKWLVRVLPLLQDRGHKVEVLFLNNRLGVCSIREQLTSFNIKCYSLLLSRSTVKDATNLLYLLEKYNPDILVGNHIPIAHLISPYTNIPVIGIIRSNNNYFKELITNFYYSSDSTISRAVCVSNELARTVEEKGYPKSRIIIAPSGAPIPDKATTFSSTSFNVVYIGRLNREEKNIHLVLDELIRFVELSPRFYATIIGGGSEYNHIKSIIHEKSLEKRISITGEISSESVYSYLSKSQAIILMSKYEGTPTALLEAMAHGVVPVITPMDSGMEELLVHEHNCLIAQGNSISDNLHVLAMNQSKWEKLSANSRLIVSSSFSTSNNVDKWNALIHEVYSETKKAPIPRKHFSSVVEDLSMALCKLIMSNNGIGRELRCEPLSKYQDIIKSLNLSEAQKRFLDPKPSMAMLDIFIVRSLILRSLKCALPNFKGKLLDVGCGIMPYRELITTATENDIEYIGLDIESPYYSAPVDVRWDGQVIPFEEKSFDSAMATEVLEHCPDPANVLLEVSRVLKPGGFFFMTVPFFWPIHNAPYDEFRYTPYSLERLLKKAGFDTILIQPMGGWDASLAQMLSLWAIRRKMPTFTTTIIRLISLQLMKFFYSRDRPANSWDSNVMCCGIEVKAWKK